MNPNTTPESRRDAIARVVISLAATGGARAVTHSAVDRRLDLPKGSTSYYFRTRADLIGAGAESMRHASHTEFSTLASRPDAAPAEVVRDYLVHLTTARPEEIRARLALAPELEPGALSGLFFSHDSATSLFADAGADRPELMATGLIDLLEGFLLRAALNSAPSASTLALDGEAVLAATNAYLTGAALAH
ncbi:TetR/AcrR family transcriptional regulator [Brevibacterium oceani]|uniref:TetR/AcrR family transcriptional regulator n=1 Tax=Brevibacterium oceani TaxID=358099 RepID=UPI0015E7AC2E|nr:TetR family transcriptional regulator [Brevibacterium oceani]